MEYLPRFARPSREGRYGADSCRMSYIERITGSDSIRPLARQHFRLDLTLQLTPLSPLFRHLNTTDFDSVDGLNHLHVYGAPRQAGMVGAPKRVVEGTKFY
jgi:hypothetical protein